MQKINRIQNPVIVYDFKQKAKKEALSFLANANERRRKR